MEKILLIDGSSLISTSFYATVPKGFVNEKTEEGRAKYQADILQTKSGLYTNGVYTMLKSMIRMINHIRPSYVFIAWDVSRNTFRKDIYKDYKATRGEKPSILSQQFETAQKVFTKLGIPQLKNEKYEADDFLGSMSKQFSKNENVHCYIWSKDKDCLQLVDDKTSLLLITSKAKELNKKYNVTKAFPEGIFEITNQNIFEEFGVNAKNIIDLKALVGDKGDNIPGIAGVGESTAIPLINHYKSIENMFDDLRDTDLTDSKQEKELKERFKAYGIKRVPFKKILSTGDKTGEELAVLSKELATIKTDLKLSFNYKKYPLHIKAKGIVEVVDGLEFKSLENALKNI